MQSTTTRSQHREPGAVPRRRAFPPPESKQGSVVTLLDASLRRLVDTATDGTFGKVHVNSVGEAIQAVQHYSPTALLLSPAVTRGKAGEISNLLAKSLGVVPIAVLGEDWPTAQASLLELGACGVREVVNLAEREGWNRLRRLVHETAAECRAIVIREISATTDGSTIEMQQFLATLARWAPEITSVLLLARRLGIDPSTLNSRFFRARLPAPRQFLVMTRLAYAAWFLETPAVSMAAVSELLRYSSPQSFGRHVRTTLGLTASRFRREVSLSRAMAHYKARLIEPYRATLEWFRPVGPVDGRASLQPPEG